MNRDQGYKLSTINNRIIPPMSEPRYDLDSVREQDL